MGSKFEECIKKKGLRISSEAKGLVKKEMDAAEKDLQEAVGGLEREAFKWTTIQSYYAMFHTARALIYAKGYREKSHYCLRIALEELYVAAGVRHFFSFNTYNSNSVNCKLFIGRVNTLS